MKETDENHLVTAYDIAGYLESCGIDAERRSIYKDIEEINKAVLMMEEECTIQEAEEMLDDAPITSVEQKHRHHSLPNTFWQKCV